jgi:hypothetical protein
MYTSNAYFKSQNKTLRYDEETQIQRPTNLYSLQDALHHEEVTHARNNNHLDPLCVQEVEPFVQHTPLIFAFCSPSTEKKRN